MAYNTWVLFKRELSTYFNSPVAYVFAVLFLGITNFIFFNVMGFFTMEQAEMRSYFALMPWVFMFFIPAITMRLWAEEEKVGTVEQLMTLPVTPVEAVLAKWLAGYVFLLFNLVLTFSVPLTIAALGDPDWGPILGGYIGSALLGATFMAIGAFASSLNKNQIIAFVLAVVFCFVLHIISLPQVVARVTEFSRVLGSVTDLIGVQVHFDNLARGVLDLRDVVYFVSVTVLFLTLNTLGVESRKY